MITKKVYTSLAKAIRDSGLSKANRDLIVRAMNKVFIDDNPLYNEYIFRQVANTVMDGNDNVQECCNAGCRNNHNKQG